MGGTRLEVFRFGMYVFVPVTVLYLFNRPDFAERFLPRRGFYPPAETLHRPPATIKDADAAYKLLREKRAAEAAAAALPAAPAAATATP